MEPATTLPMRDTGTGQFRPSDLATRFWARVERSDDCWLWTGKRMWQGYGMVWDGRTRRAHRVAYELENGRIPAGMLVLHSCDNPPCVKPAHLFLGTQQDNMDDKVAKGRAATGDRNGAHTHPETRARGERHWAARLTWESVRAMRAAAGAGESGASLARRFGISGSSIHRILTGQNWKEPLQ